MVPRRGEPSAAELLWMRAKPPEPTVKTAALGMGIGVGAVGLIIWAVGVGWEISTNQKIDTTTVDGQKTCREKPYGNDICGTLSSNLKTANLLGYLGGATLGLGATGLLIYALYPEPRPETKTIAETLPSGLGVKGTF